MVSTIVHLRVLDRIGSIREVGISEGPKVDVVVIAQDGLAGAPDRLGDGQGTTVVLIRAGRDDSSTTIDNTVTLGELLEEDPTTSQGAVSFKDRGVDLLVQVTGTAGHRDGLDRVRASRELDLTRGVLLNLKVPIELRGINTARGSGSTETKDEGVLIEEEGTIIGGDSGGEVLRGIDRVLTLPVED